MISRGVVRLHLGFLGWRGSSLGRLFTDLGKGKAAGGNAFSRSLCSPTAIAVSRGLPLSTSVILDCTCSHRWRRPGEKRKRTEIFVSMLGHCFLAHLEHYAAARVHSATLRKTRPLNASTWGVAPRLSKTWSEKASGGAVAQRRVFSATMAPKWSSLSPPLWSPLRSQPRCPRVVREDERVRISAPCHVWRRFPRSRLHSLHFHQ